MDDDFFPGFDTLYANSTQNPIEKSDKATLNSGNTKKFVKKIPLTTKNAVKLLIEGTLKTKICRYCLNMVASLSELDQILHIAGSDTMYKVTIRDIVASFHPVKVADDPNFPDKICDKCLNLALTSYLFTQQCERAERALRNCFEDIYEKLDKLDPLEKRKKRGRQKLNPNYNVIHAEHKKVIDYAEPIMNIINLGTEPLTAEPAMTKLECPKCWQVLPNTESLVNHEKTHPKTMWYHCRLCGKSFPKLNQMKKHYHRFHVLGKELKSPKDNNFKCVECGLATDNYKQHLQHIEKHKFKVIMEHLIERKMFKLCMVCQDKGAKLVDLEDMVCIHGGYPELTGERPLYSLLASTLPDMNDLQNFIGAKICEKCLNHAITAYIFINQFSFSRERLDMCVSHMLAKLEAVTLDANVFVQINENTIMPMQDDFDETLLLNENDDLDESKIKVNVLEDEFRLQLESESDAEDEAEIKSFKNKLEDGKNDVELLPDSDYIIDNLAKNAKKTYSKKKRVNGIQYTDVCSEFLTFNKRTHKTKNHCRFTCPLCKKYFISDYFLKRHIVKHVNKKVRCNLCIEEFKSKFYLYEHKKTMHLLKLNQHFACKVCGRTFMKEKKLNSHEKQHLLIECQLCNKVFADQSFYNSHMQRHATKFNCSKQKSGQTCSFCEKLCPNSNKLSIHINKVHFEIKPYSCDMCERQFYAEANLKRHKKVHSMSSIETCVFCDKTCKSRKLLVTHVRKHIGVKPFACPVCGQSFHSQFKARQHMKVYHGGRYCCGVCKTTFMTRIGLKNHMEHDHRFP